MHAQYSRLLDTHYKEQVVCFQVHYISNLPKNLYQIRHDKQVPLHHHNRNTYKVPYTYQLNLQ